MNYHNAYSYLLNPPHKITVCVIGCGGTGSQVLSILARMDLSLMALGHPGLQVTVFDDDRITDANVGRQLYAESEVGLFKADALVDRFNRFYGTKWKSMCRKFARHKFDVINQPDTNFEYNIYISCVDEFKTRIDLAETLKWISKERDNNHDLETFYWLDFGNTNNTGQAILGTLKLSYPDHPDSCDLETFDQWAAKFNKPRKSKNTPSCSLAEALEKQDLLINSSLANAGMNLLWRLFREGRIPYRGVIINLDTMTSNPIKV